MPRNIPGSEKQLEYWRNCTHRWNVKTGATRSGKTYMDYFLIPKRIIDGKGKDGLNVILGNTRETVRRNVLIPMQNIYGEKRISSIHADNSCSMFGEQVFVLGADNIGHVDKIRGMSIKYCYGDEVTTWSEELFDMLKSRLDKEYSVFDGTCNPASPNHWFKNFLDSGADIYQQHYTIFDNPFLPDGFVDNLCKEYSGTVYYSRYIEGKWALAEGLIYPMYEESIENADISKQPETYVVSLDYGTKNAFAALLWAKYGGVWYAVREYYYSGRDEGITKTDEEYAQDMDNWLADITPGNRIETIIDPSAASFIALLQKRGHRYKVIPANNGVADGIRNTATCMKKGLIKFVPGLSNWKKEIQGYVWDEKALDDTPVKVNDHLMDAMRYFVHTKRIARVRNEYNPSIYR